MVSDYPECCMAYPTGSMFESMSEISVTFFHGIWFLRKQTSIPLSLFFFLKTLDWLWLWGKELGIERPKCLGLRIKPASLWLGLAVTLSCPVSTSWTQTNTANHITARWTQTWGSSWVCPPCCLELLNNAQSLRWSELNSSSLSSRTETS